MDLAPYIRELILLNECIILPDFGGFETEYLSAQIDNDTDILLPPSKKIIFKTEYTSGGDILREYLSKQLGIKISDADKLIQDYVSEIKSKLSLGETVKIGGVGTFSANRDGALLFIAIKEENYLAESFGLEPLPFKEHHKKQPEAEAKHYLPKIHGRSNTLAFVIVGIIVISILLAATIIISARYDLFLFNIGDKHAPDDMLIIGGSDSGSSKLVEEIDASTSLKTALSFTEDKKTVPQTVAKPSERNLLIAGSFKSIRNADVLKNKLIEEGFKPEIVEVEGFYRVCVGIFPDKTTATNELQRIRRQMTRSVWLLTVKGE